MLNEPSEVESRNSATATFSFPWSWYSVKQFAEEERLQEAVVNDKALWNEYNAPLASLLFFPWL